jgi:serine/threonine protein kinase/tetratricopeptide (TPR) repeat protein
MALLEPGTQLSHYRIIEQLGQGGQATAYKAEDTRLNRMVVLKTLLPEQASSENARRRFEREARLASALDHPNICAIYDIGEKNGLYFIVMPFIEGRTLKEVINRQALELRSALSIAIQVAEAITAAHARGIVHRDIKPTNIIVSGQGQIKVLDFGLAKMLENEHEGGSNLDKSMTEIGVPYGTLGYGSPEQATGERVDHRTDVFSLGVVIYEMITGQPPFTGRNRIEVLHAVINDRPYPISDLVVNPPAELQALLDHAMAKKPKDRFPTMAAMRDELRSLLRLVSSESGGITTETATLIAPRHARTTWRISSTIGRMLGGGVFGMFRSGAGEKEDRGPRSVAGDAPSQMSQPPSGSGQSSSPSNRPVSWGTETKRTIAVLPFQNLSGNAEDNFYEFSLADGLIAELANLRSLVVRPSQYIAQYTGQKVDPRQIGLDLAVNTVLTGSFIKSGERFRVTTQLIDINSGKMLWSEKIDLDSRDLITIQDRIAERVISGLKLRLTEEEQKKIEKPLTESNEAYEFYLRGRDLLFQYMSHTFDDQDLDDAIKMFEEAIRTDPKFARAHYTLGRCFVHHGQGYGGAEYFQRAETALQRAIALDPDIPGAHLQMVYVYLNRGEKDKALATLAEVRRKAPNDPTVFIVAGMLYRLNGLYDRALKQYDRLVELSPRDIVIAGYNRGRILTYRHEYEEALAAFAAARAVEPDHPLIKTFLAVTFFNMGRIDDCQQLVEEVLEQHPHFEPIHILRGWCYSARGEHDKALSVITDQVRETAAADHDIAVWMASLYAMEMRRDEAIEWIRRAVSLGNENYPMFADNNRLDNLRSDLRFVDLMSELEKKWEERR